MTEKPTDAAQQTALANLDAEAVLLAFYAGDGGEYRHLVPDMQRTLAPAVAKMAAQAERIRVLEAQVAAVLAWCAAVARDEYDPKESPKQIVNHLARLLDASPAPQPAPNEKQRCNVCGLPQATADANCACPKPAPSDVIQELIREGDEALAAGRSTVYESAEAFQTAFAPNAAPEATDAAVRFIVGDRVRHLYNRTEILGTISAVAGADSAVEPERTIYYVRWDEHPDPPDTPFMSSVLALAESPTTDVASESDGDLYTRLGMDGVKWAEEYVKRFGGDLETAQGWFCNAIMAGYDNANNRMERILDAVPCAHLMEGGVRCTTTHGDHGRVWFKDKHDWTPPAAIADALQKGGA